jgi:hypothetical protein
VKLRSYVLPYKGNVLDSANAAGGDSKLVDQCEGMRTCAACLAFSYKTLTCEWQPLERVCVAKGTSVPGVLIATMCGTAKPMKEKGVDNINFGDMPVGLIWIVPIIVSFACTCCCVAYDLKRNKESLRVHLNHEQTLNQHEKRFTEARRGDERLLHHVCSPNVLLMLC